MIFTRTRLNDRTTIEIVVCKDNTFARCPRCGRDFPIDLTRFVGDGSFDLTGSEILCEECSLELLRKLEARKRENT